MTNVDRVIISRENSVAEASCGKPTESVFDAPSDGGKTCRFACKGN